MKEENNERFVQFPLYLIRDLFTNKKETIQRIMYFGIWKYSFTFHFKEKENIQDYITKVARQLMYGYYRTGLTSELKKTIKNYISKKRITIDETYNGFSSSGESFDPFEEMQQVQILFNENESFKINAMEYYRMHMAMESLRITPGSIDSTLNEAKEVSAKIPENDPMPMINVTRLFNFLKNEKSEFELVQLAAYIGIRSIIGKKQYCKTNKLHIVSRMFGYTSHKQVPIDFKSEYLKELHKKYSHRYHIDKVIRELELNWNVLTYSNNIRGLYIAMKNKIGIEALAIASEIKKRKNQIAELKQSKIEARKKAIEQLNKAQQLNEATPVNHRPYST